MYYTEEKQPLKFSHCPSSFSERGIRKYIISVGTVDVVRLPDTSSERSQVAKEVANTVLSISQLVHASSSVCYIIPAPNNRMTNASYTQFATQIVQTLAQTNIKILSFANVMRDSIQPTENLYDDILQSCLHDGIHWCHSFAAKVISEA